MSVFSPTFPLATEWCKNYSPLGGFSKNLFYDIWTNSEEAYSSPITAVLLLGRRIVKFEFTSRYFLSFMVYPSGLRLIDALAGELLSLLIRIIMSFFENVG